MSNTIKSGVYSVRCKTSKTTYIDFASNAYNRVRVFKSQLISGKIGKKNSKLLSDFQKYGIGDFEFVVDKICTVAFKYTTLDEVWEKLYAEKWKFYNQVNERGITVGEHYIETKPTAGKMFEQISNSIEGRDGYKAIFFPDESRIVKQAERMASYYDGKSCQAMIGLVDTLLEQIS